MTAPLLSIRNLQVSFETPDGIVRAVNDLSFDLAAGEALGIVGESGSGKSQTALAILGLLSQNGRVEGSVRFQGRELLGLTPRELNRVRGREIGIVFQDPMTSLNPYLTVGTQMAEVSQRHQGTSRRQALAEAQRMLDVVHIADAAARLKLYPHELSGGMRQRVMIAMTLMCGPKLLLADEPTTVLDVTVQAQILDLLAELRREFSVSIVLITHDLGVVAELCERTLVMYAGRAMELGPTTQLLLQPTHPYTRGLLDSLPRLDAPLTQSLATIPGNPPDAARLPPGCPFAPRCSFADGECRERLPPVETTEGIDRLCHRSVTTVRQAAIAR
jgi:oligopeptide transport system ATP-binding protein